MKSGRYSSFTHRVSRTVCGLPIADCRFPIGACSNSDWQSVIANRKSSRPTRHRVVVLTSLRYENLNAAS